MASAKSTSSWHFRSQLLRRLVPDSRLASHPALSLAQPREPNRPAAHAKFQPDRPDRAADSSQPRSPPAPPPSLRDLSRRIVVPDLGSPHTTRTQPRMVDGNDVGD